LTRARFEAVEQAAIADGAPEPKSSRHGRRPLLSQVRK